MRKNGACWNASIAAMGRLFAIADLHLSSSGAKPMDVFGAVWTDHAARIASAWDEAVAAADIVLLPGDLSWARDLDEARPDLAWIGARPGTKYLLRGNHDGWWSSLAKVRAALPAGCHALQNDAFDLGGVVLVGARGWTAPEDPVATEGDEAIFVRELERLGLSIAFADTAFGREKPRVAMLHYPPWIEGRGPTDVVRALRAGGVGTCVYGHLHGADHALAVQGVRDGIRYKLVAADAIGFAPSLLHCAE
jgi:predicted phosphohydrolase